MKGSRRVGRKCLWHEKNGQCISCKAKRVRSDALGIPNFETYWREEDYKICNSFKWIQIQSDNPRMTGSHLFNRVRTYRAYHMPNKQAFRLHLDLRSPDRETKLNALEKLKQLLLVKQGDTSYLEPLTGLLSADDLEVRKSASWCVGKLAQNKVMGAYPLDLLINLLKDDEPEVKANAVWALGELPGMKIGLDSSIEPINQLLLDVSAEIRGMAAWALGRIAERMGIGRSTSIPLLRKLMEDPSKYVQKSAEWALARIMNLSSVGSGNPKT